jgi:hypothetical protein
LTYTTTTRLVAAGCGTRLSLSLAPRLPWAACVLGGQFNGVNATNTERIGAHLARLKQLLEAEAVANP